MKKLLLALGLLALAAVAEAQATLTPIYLTLQPFSGGVDAGSTSGYTTIDNEGTPLTARATVNFIGAGVDCVDDAGGAETDCTITSGGGAEPSDGDKGDITVSGSGLVWTIDASSVAIGTDVSGLGAGVATWLATASSANLAAAVTDETGTAGALVFSTAPTISGATLTAVASATFVDNVTVTMNPGTTNAGINVGAVAGTPTAPVDGDIWYNDTADDLRARIVGRSFRLGEWGPPNRICDDFVGTTSVTTPGGNLITWLATNSGTGSGLGPASSTYLSGRPGTFNLEAGSTDTGSSSVSLGTNATTQWSANMALEFMINLEDLSGADANDTYIIRLGINDVTTGVDGTDSIGFKYTNGINSGAWYFYSCSNSVCADVMGSGAAVAAGTWYRLTMIQNNANNVCEFFVNGVSIGSITDTAVMPLGASRVGNVTMSMLNLDTGTHTANEPSLLVDYMCLYPGHRN